MKSAKKPIPRSRAWQRGYNSGTNPCKMPKENPYKEFDTSYNMTGGLVHSSELYHYYTSDEYQKKCRENQRYVDWISGFAAGRKQTRRLKMLSKRFEADDAEYDIYANLGEELGY